MYDVMNRTGDAMLELVFGSAVSYPLMWLGGERTPHVPTEADYAEISAGSRYHKAKGWFGVWYKKDAEYWQKLTRFLIWWLILIVVIQWFSQN